MSHLPDTTLQHYLTGTSAMTIPDGEGDFVNWHFTDTFLGGKASFRIAGRNFPDTAALFGTTGVRECSEILRRSGVELSASQKFYAANRDRALLDLVVANVQQGKTLDHLRIEDFADSEAEAAHLHELFQSLYSRLESPDQIRCIQKWLQHQ
jgi:hypothetical protein